MSVSKCLSQTDLYHDYQTTRNNHHLHTSCGSSGIWLRHNRDKQVGKNGRHDRQGQTHDRVTFMLVVTASAEQILQDLQASGCYFENRIEQHLFLALALA